MIAFVCNLDRVDVQSSREYIYGFSLLRNKKLALLCLFVSFLEHTCLVHLKSVYPFASSSSFWSFLSLCVRFQWTTFTFCLFEVLELFEH